MKNLLYGVKKITPHNINSSDLVGFSFTQPEWIAWFDEIQLHCAVSEDLFRQFEVARGTMISAWFYYPLLTVGFEQCHRIVESAVRLFAKEHGFDTKDAIRHGKRRTQTAKYAELIDEIFKRGVAPETDRIRWDAGRYLRNSSAHPEGQNIMLPSDAKMALRVCAERIETLFPPRARSEC